ncbi:MAG: serine hydrolase [Caldilineaceae bacterium]|nr:serine hydrolase [Caldilineaceae bacterium]
MRRVPPSRFWIFTILLVAILSLFRLYGYYKGIAAPVPPGVLLGGVDVSGLKSAAEIRAHMDPIYHQPIGVRFQNRLLLLDPDDLDFVVDFDEMVADAGRYLEGWSFLDIAVREAIGLPQHTRTVALRYSLNEAKLRTWLEEQAAQLDYAPILARAVPIEPEPASLGTPEADPATPTPGASASAGSQENAFTLAELSGPTLVTDWRWIPGASGYQIDVDASLARIVDTLTASEARIVDLALIEKPTPPPNMADLANMIERRLADFPGVAGVYVYDLQHGDEAGVNAGVAFSGMSTLKVALAAALMQQLSDGVAANNPAAQQLGQWLDYGLGESNNYAANQIISWLGDGDVDAGALRFTDFARSLGFENTYMQTGYDSGPRPQVPTPANQGTIETSPDTNLQTTPAELGRFLVAIYECTQGKGILIEIYPAQIKPEECSTVLFYMTHDEFREMVWGGLPDRDERWIVHKHGFSALQHSDLAFVWGPNGPYVIGVFLYRPGWLDWGTSNDTFADISRLVWRFFEFQQRLAPANPGPPPDLTPPPGYLAVASYAPSAANPGGR